jgi:drug/metabolite transporter (DMT)-like permease
LLFAYGEQQVDSTVAGVLNATTPLWTALIAVAARTEKKPPAVKLAGLGLPIAGALVIFEPWRSGFQVHPIAPPSAAREHSEPLFTRPASLGSLNEPSTHTESSDTVLSTEIAWG